MGNGRLRPIENCLTKTSYAGNQGGVISFMDVVALVTYVGGRSPSPCTKDAGNTRPSINQGQSLGPPVPRYPGKFDLCCCC